MRFKNNGFAISAVLYGLLVLFLILVVAMVGMISSYKANNGHLIEDSGGGAEKIIHEGLEVSDMVVIKMIDGTKKRCKSSKYDPPKSYVDGELEDVKKEFADYLVSYECKADECYFYMSDIECKTESIGFKCSTILYKECINTSDDTLVDTKYASDNVYTSSETEVIEIID